ncbi:MAG: WXG100 family type VII secretion target [Anaerolineae bacterium]|jgi:WXG100 family type VII secretion target|nr:WXG100 family type VII secretion target [Anaerolineae bacterium]
MAAETIQANYEELDQASGNLSREAEVVEGILTKIISAKDNMMAQSAGTWSEKFQGEMSGTIIPRINRLMEALSTASSSIKNIVNEVQEAEDRAGGLFRS